MNLNISALKKTLDSTNTSYKYLFFYALIKIINNNPKIKKITFNKLVKEMLIIAWLPAFQFNLNFRKQDQTQYLLTKFNYNTDKDLIEKALEFAHIYSTEVFKRIESTLGMKLMYDIGMSSGIGLLGLQGPEKLKKTTITGESAGTAKRLETEAKRLRENNAYNFPILIIDRDLYRYAKEMKIFTQSFEEIIATTKDIKDGKFYKLNT